MNLIATAPARVQAGRNEGVSWLRIAWVAPLALVVSVAACLAIRAIAQSLSPNLNRMAQLGPAMVTLAVEGALAAILVYLLFALFVPRPNFWFRIAGAVALVLSWTPDIALGLGGTPMQLALRYVAPLTNLRLPGISGSNGPPAGGPPPGAQTGGPPGFFGSMPIEQVLLLMLLHTAVAVVCIAMLTTLTTRSSHENAGGRRKRSWFGRSARSDVPG